MLEINGKKFMNLPEAVQWLLNNNALPFQSTASFVPNTEIAKSTIINPSPAEIKIGSLVLFADGKVGTVSGITSNGFMVGAESTDLSDGVPHITGISINASQHLIFTMSEGSPIDAGLVKMVSGFSINASQHLIVSYNDGTTADLGAIFQGNINISGSLTADSIIENMSGYSFGVGEPEVTTTYAGVVKNGNKITFAICGSIKLTSVKNQLELGRFVIPAEIDAKLFGGFLGGAYLDVKPLYCADALTSGVSKPALLFKAGSNTLICNLYNTGDMSLNTDYFFRYEVTFLLSDNMAA